jgi:hypothetical protein
VAESLESKEELNRNKILLENLKLKPEKQQLILPTLQGFDVVKTEDIVRLQADGNFTQVYLTDGSKNGLPFLNISMTCWKTFVRVHRSHIINTGFVKSYHKSGTVTFPTIPKLKFRKFQRQFSESFFLIFGQLKTSFVNFDKKPSLFSHLCLPLPLFCFTKRAPFKSGCKDSTLKQIDLSLLPIKASIRSTILKYCG